MQNADVNGFLLAAVAVGALVSAAIILPLRYTIGTRGWIPGNRAPWAATLVGAFWLIMVAAGAIYLSFLCGRVFGIKGNSDPAQTARMLFTLIWAGITTVSTIIAGSLVVWKKEKADRAIQNRSGGWN